MIDRAFKKEACYFFDDQIQGNAELQSVASSGQNRKFNVQEAGDVGLMKHCGTGAFLKRANVLWKG